MRLLALSAAVLLASIAPAAGQWTTLGDMPAPEAIDFLLKQMQRSKTNREFFQQMAQG